MRRKIIEIDEKKCTGCGLCIPNCPEGALQIIDGKARLVSGLLCDGLGACIGHCPEGAIRVEEGEAEEYDERRVMENLVKGGRGVIRAHLDHLRSHGQREYLETALDFLKQKDITVPREERGSAASCGCPGAKVVDFEKERTVSPGARGASAAESQLGQWPIQIRLVPPAAPFFRDADLLIAADCVPFAYAGFHDDLLRGKVLLVGCPKFDDAAMYQEKLTQILKAHDIRSVTVARMEVPCCYGLVKISRDAIRACGNEIPLREVEIGIKGEKK